MCIHDLFRGSLIKPYNLTILQSCRHSVLTRHVLIDLVLIDGALAALRQTLAAAAQGVYA